MIAVGSYKIWSLLEQQHKEAEVMCFVLFLFQNLMSCRHNAVWLTHSQSEEQQKHLLPLEVTC